MTLIVKAGHGAPNTANNREPSGPQVMLGAAAEVTALTLWRRLVQAAMIYCSISHLFFLGRGIIITLRGACTPSIIMRSSLKEAKMEGCFFFYPIMSRKQR